MKRKLLTILCAMTLTLSVLPAAGAGEEPVPPSDGTAEPVETVLPSEPGEEELEEAGIRVLVGLFYGSDALPGANLMNSKGEGYRFGYLDEERVFHPLADTDETTISMVKTQNVWLEPSGTKYRSYSDQTTSDTLVGCWHVLTPQLFADYEGAAEYAGSLEDVMAFPAWINGVWQVRVGAFATREEAEALSGDFEGSVVAGTSAYGVSVVKTGTAQILFQFDGQREDLPLTVRPKRTDDEKATTWFRGSRYYGDFQYRRVGGGDLTVINAVDSDDYVSCVISQEMSPSWPIEALKAQAVCARNYAENRRVEGKHRRQGFDVCSTMDCQAYPGLDRETERTRQAADETAGLRAWYDGKTADTFYFSSDGGATEDVKNVWGSSNYPYLKGVIDPYEEDVQDKIYEYQSTKVFTSSELAAKLQAKGYACSNIADVQLILTPTGNVQRITFIDDRGTPYPFVHESGVRNLLGLRSMRYQVEKRGGASGGVWYADDGEALSAASELYAVGADGTVERVSGSPYVISGSGTVQALPDPAGESAGEITFVFHVSGWGHNVGMSQWGAYAMAMQGKTFEEILKFYYTGIELY